MTKTARETFACKKHTPSLSPVFKLCKQSRPPFIHHDYCMCLESTTNIWTDSAYLVAVTHRLLFQQTPAADAEPGAFFKGSDLSWHNTPAITNVNWIDTDSLLRLLRLEMQWHLSRARQCFGFFFLRHFHPHFFWISPCFCPLTSSLLVHMHRINSPRSGRAGEKSNKCGCVCMRLCLHVYVPVALFPRRCKL